MLAAARVGWVVGALMIAGVARAESDSATADRMYAAGNFDKALAQYTLLSAGNPKDTYLRMRMLQCRLALGDITPAQERELRDLRTTWGRETVRRLAEVRDAALRAQGLARSGKVEAAAGLLATAEQTLNDLSREVDVTAGRRQVAEARRLVQTAAATPAVRDRPAGDPPSPFAGRYRSVKEGDHYRIVLVQDEKAKLDAPGDAPKDAAKDGAAGAPAPKGAPYQESVDGFPGRELPNALKLTYEDQNGRGEWSFNLFKGPEEGLWMRREFEGQPPRIKEDVLKISQYNRVAPKYYYDRWLEWDRERSFGLAMQALRRESQMPVLCAPHDYVVELPRGVDYRKPAVEEVPLGAEGNMETVLYDLSTVLLPTDGPFDGISYVDYHTLGYRGLFALGLTGGYGSGGYGYYPWGWGWGTGGGYPVFGGGGPTTGSRIINGGAEDFAYGYPYVLNYLFGDRFGWHDPAQTAAVMQMLNQIVRDPSLMPQHRPPARPPMPMPMPEKKP